MLLGSVWEVNMNQVLLLYGDMPMQAMEALKAQAQVAGPFGAQDDWQALLQDADAIITGVGIQFTDQVLDQALRLRVIGRPGIGVDNLDLAAATERGICIVNTPDAPTEPVAEKVVGWIIMLAHRLREADRVARAAGWLERKTLRGHDLVSKTRAGRRGARGRTSGADLFRHIRDARPGLRPVCEPGTRSPVRDRASWQPRLPAAGVRLSLAALPIDK